MVNEFLIRLGTFFTLIGICLIILFVATYLGNAPDFLYFFLGLISMSSAGGCRNVKRLRHRADVLHTLRKMRENSKKHQDEGKKEKE